MNGEVMPLRRVIFIDGVFHVIFPRHSYERSNDKNFTPRTKVIESLWPYQNAANDPRPTKPIKKG